MREERIVGSDDEYLGTSVFLLESFRIMGVPGRVKEFKGLGEDVIVDETSVHRKEAHQQNDVAAAKKHIKYLEQSKNNHNQISW